MADRDYEAPNADDDGKPVKVVDERVFTAEYDMGNGYSGYITGSATALVAWQKSVKRQFKIDVEMTQIR